MNKFEQEFHKEGILYYIVLAITFVILIGVLSLISAYLIFFLLAVGVYTIWADDEVEQSNTTRSRYGLHEYNGTIPDTYTAGNQYMSAKEKREYLKSSKWKTLRDLMYILHDSKCECCGNSESLEVHHNTYERLGSEDLSDLNLVCRGCHQDIHDRLGYDRTTQYPIK